MNLDTVAIEAQYEDVLFDIKKSDPLYIESLGTLVNTPHGEKEHQKGTDIINCQNLYGLSRCHINRSTGLMFTQTSQIINTANTS